MTSWSRREGVDITNGESVEQAAAHLRPVDVVIHNAGIYHFEILGMVNMEWMERQFATNVVGAERVQEWLVTSGRLRLNGLVLAISSVDVLDPLPNQSGYQISKAALEMLVKSWALDTPEYQYKIYRAHLTDTGIWDPFRGPAEYTLERTVKEICQLILS